MRYPILSSLLRVGVLCAGTCMIADEIPPNGQCFGVDSRYDCVHLGELTDSVSVVGNFKSCTEAAVPVPLTSREAPDSTVVYQFDVTAKGRVKLVIKGLGNAWVFKDGTQAFRADANVNSIERSFDRGRYTLVGHAPLCGNGMSDWNGGYTILIDPQGWEGSDRGASGAAGTDRIVVMNPEERKHPLVRTAKWTFIVLSTLLAIVVLAFAFGGDAA